MDVKKKIFQTSCSGGSYSSPEENENLYLKDYILRSKGSTAGRRGASGGLPLVSTLFCGAYPFKMGSRILTNIPGVVGWQLVPNPKCTQAITLR
jgi:hypothetical protein